MLWWTLRQLKSGDVETRKRAAKALGELGNPKSVAPLVAALKDSDRSVMWVVNKALISVLTKLGGTQTIEPLIAALKTRDSDLISRAQKSLVKIGIGAVKPLIGVLRDSPEFGWRQDVVEVLGKIGAIAVEPLLALLKDSSWHVRRSSVDALGKIDDAQAIERLIIALKDPASEVRCSVATALGEIGDSRAVEPLFAKLKDSQEREDVRNAAEAALSALNWKPVDATQQAMMFVALRKWDEATRLGVAAVQPLIIALEDSDKEVSEEAARALRKIGASAVERLIVALKESSPPGRRLAARLLGQIGETRAIETLLIALTDSSEGVGWSAANALKALKWEPIGETQEAMMLVVNRKWDDATALGSVAVAPLIVAVRGGEKSAAIALRKIGDTAVEPLINVLRDSAWNVRTNAAEALGRRGNARGVEPLIAALKAPFVDKGPEWYLRSAVLKALGEIGDARAVAPLMLALKICPSYFGTYIEHSRLTVGALNSIIQSPEISTLGDAILEQLMEIEDVTRTNFDGGYDVGTISGPRYVEKKFRNIDRVSCALIRTAAKAEVARRASQ